MKTDINNRQDIENLVNAFYSQVEKDPIIGEFFTQVANIDWAEHLPQMYDFWESILFSKNVFTGNPMKKHKELNQKRALNMLHFEQWLSLFNAAVDNLYTGKNATRIKEYAAIIKGNLSSRTISPS